MGRAVEEVREGGTVPVLLTGMTLLSCSPAGADYSPPSTLSHSPRSMGFPAGRRPHHLSSTSLSPPSSLLQFLRACPRATHARG